MGLVKRGASIDGSLIARLRPSTVVTGQRRCADGAVSPSTATTPTQKIYSLPQPAVVRFGG